MPTRRFINTPTGSTLHFGIVADGANFTATAEDSQGNTWQRPDLMDPGVTLPLPNLPEHVTIEVFFAGPATVAVVCWVDLPDGTKAGREPILLQGSAGQAGTADIRVLA